MATAKEAASRSSEPSRASASSRADAASSSCASASALAAVSTATMPSRRARSSPARSSASVAALRAASDSAARCGRRGELRLKGVGMPSLRRSVPLERLCSHPRFGDDSLQAAVGGRLRRRCRILLQPSGFRYRGGGSPAVEVLRGGGHVVGACHLATRFRLGAGGEYEHLAYLVALADAAVVEVAVGDRGEHVAAVSGCLHDVTSRTGRGTRGTRPYGRLSTHRAPRV